MYKAAQPAFAKASENAKRNKSPYGIVIITTPNNKDEGPGGFCYKEVLSKAARWNLDCYDFTDDELNEFVQNNSQNNFIFVQFTYKELGHDEAWFEEQKRNLFGDLWTIKREILLDWPISREGAAFTEAEISRVESFIKEPVSHLYSSKKYVIDLYEIPDLNMNYILSCDVSGGLSKDNSTINIIHPEDFRVVGAFRNDKIDTDNFRELIEEMMTIYFRNGLLIIERNSYGLNIIDQLKKKPEILNRMYSEFKEHIGEIKQRDGTNIKQKTKTRVYGVDTTGKTRQQMMDLLPELINNEPEKFVSPYIFDDIRGLEFRNGRIDHKVDGHDDSLMAYLIFRRAVLYGKCFRERFGIYPVASKSNVRVVSSTENYQKIVNLINAADAADSKGFLNYNNSFKALSAQQEKINKYYDENTTLEYRSDNAEEDAKLNSFRKIASWNN